MLQCFRMAMCFCGTNTIYFKSEVFILIFVPQNKHQKGEMRSNMSRVVNGILSNQAPSNQGWYLFKTNCQSNDSKIMLKRKARGLGCSSVTMSGNFQFNFQHLHNILHPQMLKAPKIVSSQ